MSTLTWIVAASTLTLGFANQVVQLDCANPSTLWETYACPLEAVTTLQDQCHPRYTISKSKKARGLVVAFHGYSACPDSFDELASAWLETGYDVMVPLLPGQGRARGECANNDLGTTSTLSDGTTIICAGKDRIDELPTKRQGYIDFIETINSIVTEEKCHRGYKQVIAAGLSHGGPLATYAVNTAPEKLYDKLFIMNPSFAATNPPLDRDFAACVNSGTPDCVALLTQALLANIDVDDRGAGGILETVLQVDDSIQNVLDEVATGISAMNSEEQKYSIIQFAVRRLLTTAIENFELLSEEAMMLVGSAVYSWGEQCELERDNGRGGICSFLARNVIAAHSFGQLALRTIGLKESSSPKAWQIVTTERDAVSRNTLIFQAALSLMYKKHQRGGRGGNLCMYRIVCSLEGSGNDCGVPHSMLSRAEQELQGEIYWIDDLIQGSIKFFTSGMPYGAITDPGFPFTIDDRAVCQRLTVSPEEPSFDLSLPKTRGLWLRFELDDSMGPLDLLQQAQVAQAVTDLLGVMPGQVQVVDLEIVASPFDEDANIQELYLEIPSTLEHKVLARLEQDLLATVFSFGDELLEVEIAGRHPRSTSSSSGSRKYKRSAPRNQRKPFSEEKKTKPCKS